MNIITGNRLDKILQTCKFRLDSGLVRLDYQKYSQKSGKFVLILEFFASENLTGISSQKNVKKQIWILEQEVKKKNIFQTETRYFEFEIIDERDSKIKLYFPSREFAYTLLHLCNLKEFSLGELHDTIGLIDNDEISYYWMQDQIKDLKNEYLAD